MRLTILLWLKQRTKNVSRFLFAFIFGHAQHLRYYSDKTRILSFTKISTYNGKNWSNILFTDIETKQNGIESILILQHYIIQLKDFIRMSCTLLGTIEKVFLLSICLP